MSAGQATLSDVGTLTLTGTDATLDEYSGTIMLSGMIAGGTVNLAGGAYFIDEGGSLTGALNAAYNADLDVNGYTLTLSGNGSVRSFVYGGGTLDIAGIYDVGGLYLASGTEELVTGTAIQDDHNRLDYDNGADPSVLSIASTGTYDVTVVDSNIDEYGPLGTIINSGLFENVVSLASYTYNEQYFSFFSYFNVYQNFTNSSTGTIYIGASDDISLLQGTSDLSGTITGPGNIAFGQGDTATLAAGLVLNTGGMQITDGNTDVILESNRTFSAATFVLQNGASLSLNGYTADLSGGGALAAYIVGPGTLDVSGTYTVGGLYLSSGVTEILTGLEIQTDETRFDYDGGSVSTVLSIASSGIYDITTDSIQDDYYNYDNYGTIINAGLFEKTGLDGNSAINASFTNASTGRIFIDAGNELLLVNANTNILAGTIGGPGTLDLGNSGTFKLQAGLSLSVGELIVDSSSRAILESNRTFSSADFVLQNNASLALNGHTAYLNGSGDLAAYVSGPGTLRVGGTFYTTADLLSGVTDIITGVEVQNGTSYLDSDSGSAATVLSIATGGVYDIVADNVERFSLAGAAHGSSRSGTSIGAAPVSEKRIGLNRGPDRQRYGR